MTNVCTLGLRGGSESGGTLVDFNNRDRFRYSSTGSVPPNPQFERSMKPNRGQPGSQLLIERMLGTPVEFDIYCLGDQLDIENGYQQALDSYAAIIDLLSKASKYSKPGHEGAPVFYTKQVRDQLAPQVWQVSYGEFVRSDEQLEAGNLILGRLKLFCSPIPTSGVTTTKTSPILCNYDTWTINVGGTEPIAAKVSVLPLGDADHYDRIRVTNLPEASGVSPVNHIWPLLTGPQSAPTGYTVEALATGRIASVVMTIRAKGTGSYRAQWRDAGGGLWDADKVTVCDDGAAYKTYTHDVSLNPATQLPFTLAELNGGQWGVKKVGATAVRITQLYVTVAYLDRDLVAHETELLPSADGASGAWGLTGAATTFDAIRDAVGADDGDTTRITSTADGQVSLIEVPNYAGLTDDTGVRAHIRGIGGFVNGGFEAPYSGPTFGATLVDDPLTLDGWTPPFDRIVFYDMDGPGGELRVRPTPGAGALRLPFIMKAYGGLTPGVPIRIQVEMKSVLGAPAGQGARMQIQDGQFRQMDLRTSSSLFNVAYIDIVPVGESVTLALFNEGTFSFTDAVYKNLKIREIESYAQGWAPIGTLKGSQEKQFVKTGLSAQSFGVGDDANYIGQTIGVIDGESYRVVANLRTNYFARSEPVKSWFAVESGANQESAYTLNAFDFDRLELTIQADGDALTLKAWADEGGVGVIDSVFVQRVTAPTDQGAVALRYTIADNVTDYYGSHQVWARIRTSGAPVQVQVRYGGDDGQLIASNPVNIDPSTGVRSAKLGAVVIPPSNTDPDAPIEQFKFTVLLFPSEDTADTADVDFDVVELWPARNSVLGLATPNAGPALNQRQVFDGGSRTIYVASSTGGTVRTITGREGDFVTLYPGRNRIFARVSRAEDDDRLCPEDTFRLILAYAEAGIVRHVFSPDDLATRFDYWYRAYELPAGVFTVWEDESGNNRDTNTHGGTTTVVAGVLNGLPIVRLSSSGLFRWPEIAFPSGVQIFLLAKIDTAVFQGTWVRTSATPGPNYGIGISGTDLWVHRYSDNNNNAVKKKKVVAGVPLDWALYTVTDDGTGGTLTLMINGSPQAIVTDGTNISGASGLDPDGTITADVAQLIIAHDLTEDEIADLNSFILAEVGM